jgi:hypothetical protein
VAEASVTATGPIELQIQSRLASADNYNPAGLSLVTICRTPTTDRL